MIRLLPILVFFLVSFTTMAQTDSIRSREYYKSYQRHVTGRLYLSKKYTDFLLRAPGQFNDMRYRPNNAFNAGVGATDGAFTLNLGFNFGFLDRNRDERGKTKFLDLQTHFYPRNWVIDFYGQFYRGYFMSPRGRAMADPDKFYLRPDLKVSVVGASVFRLFNGDQFSYRASYLQNEWQKKSAGSFLLGMEFYTGRVRGDSALLPSNADENMRQEGITQLRFTEFGPGAGYTYTGVIQQHFFITGSATVNADVSFVKETRDDEILKKTSISPNVTARAVAGYNNDRWGLALSWVNNRISLRGRQGGDTYLISTGNIRLTYVKRFRPGKKFEDRMKSLKIATP